MTDFDLIGISYYRALHKPSTIAETGALIQTLKNKYQKEVMIFETGYIWTNTSQDQATSKKSFSAKDCTLNTNLYDFSINKHYYFIRTAKILLKFLFTFGCDSESPGCQLLPVEGQPD